MQAGGDVVEFFRLKRGNDMSKNAKKTQEIEGLSPQQNMVIFHLLTGKTATEAAAETGVDMATVSRWRNHDAAFIAELNRRSADLWDAHHAELRSLATEARKVLRESMERGPNRLRAAVWILENMGPRPAGPTDERDITIAQARKRSSQELDEIIVGL